MENLFNFVGRSVCHQIPERTLVVGEHILPVCARCTGIYISIFLSVIFLFLLKRFKGNKPLSIFIALFFSTCISFMAIDGLSSYLQLRDTTNLMRIVTGGLTGFGFPAFYILIMNFDLNGKNEITIVKNYEFVLLCLIGVAFPLLIYLEIFNFWFISSITICFGIFLLFFGVVSLLLKRILNIEKKIYSIITSCFIITLFSFINLHIREIAK